jgi:hypothetical protein
VCIVGRVAHRQRAHFISIVRGLVRASCTYTDSSLLLHKMPSADDLKTPTRTPSRTPSGSPKPPRASSGGGGPSRQGSGAGSDGTPSRQGSGAGPARTVSGGGGGDVAEVDPLCIVVLSNNLSSEDLTVVSRARSHHQHTPATVLENLSDPGQRKSRLCQECLFCCAIGL